MTDDGLWYKDAIIYQLHVKAFFDSTNDGIGDFVGLTSKLDYLHDLGVTALWTLPFYPSPLRDDGYDISDYQNVNPAYGKVRDFRRFVREAHRRDMRIITELVVNHTSDQHPWFQRARKAKPGSVWRDYYVWSDSDEKYDGTRIIFTDTEMSNWTWDPVAGSYYWHRFFSHQPDLNFENARVLKAVIAAMEFWLDMGVDGLRLDAIPYLCEREGTNNENLPETHDVIKKIREALDANYSDRMLLGEANQWPEDVLPYFADGDECHMAFHFPLMPRMYMAIAQEDRHPITDIMRQTPDIPESCQWAVFLRNHDELTLEMVTNRERDYLWNFYAADPRMRVNLGIRRRLAPLLENDRRKIELLNSLLMSMPGTPILYYGDEIGMGDNIYLGDRDSMRTPMQWSPDRNAGFSRADPASLYLPPIMDPVYGYESVNVEAQSRSPSSLLNWTKRLIAARRNQPAFGRGSLEFLYPGNRKILAYLREHSTGTVLCVANLSRAAQPVELDLSRFNGRVPVELMGQTPFPPIGELPYFVTLPGHGFYWFLLAEEAKAPAWHETYASPIPELNTLVIPNHWESVTSGPARRLLESRVLPNFLMNQRWFAGKGDSISSVRQSTHAVVPGSDRDWLLAFYDVASGGQRHHTYLIPLSIAWEIGAEDPLSKLLPFTLARVRKGSQMGILSDAVADDVFVRTMFGLISENKRIPASSAGEIRFNATSALEPIAGLDEMPVTRAGNEQTNSSLRIGDNVILKLYRKLERGIHPEIEMGRYLTDIAQFSNSPRLLGSVEFVGPDGQPTATAVVHEVVRNQGDGWTYTREYLTRFAERERLLSGTEAPLEESRHAGYAELARILGKRVAELHIALSQDTANPAFRPEPVTAHDLRSWVRNIQRDGRKAFSALRRGRKSLRPDLVDGVDRVLAARDGILDRIGAMVPEDARALKARYHGDLHLGQVLLHQNDFFIIDFEGEPARPMSQRRLKHSPLRDVAGMLRSFSYAACSATIEGESIGVQTRNDLEPLMQEWEETASGHFLEGYFDTMGGLPSRPGDEATATAFIRLFTLEKTFYEITYEAANRPAWLEIPVLGMLRLFEQRD